MHQCVKCAVLVFAVCLWGSVSSLKAFAEVVADFSQDYFNQEALDSFASGFPVGWRYLWNAPSDWIDGQPADPQNPFGSPGFAGSSATFQGGPLGASAGYREMLFEDAFFDIFTPDGQPAPGTGEPAKFMRLGATFLHPGRAAGQISPAGNPGIFNQYDRNVIIEYTVDEDADYSIVNSNIKMGDTNSTDGVRLLVFLNDDISNLFVDLGIQGNSIASHNFDISLGNLTAGDKIYVAISPDGPGPVTTIEATADFNSSSFVDGRDFLIWQRNFGLAGQTNNSNGDANRDGVVNSLDLAAWQLQYGGGSIPLAEDNSDFIQPFGFQIDKVVPAAIASIPEPSSLILTLLALSSLPIRKVN